MSAPQPGVADGPPLCAVEDRGRCGEPLGAGITVLLEVDGTAVSCHRRAKTQVVVSVKDYTTISQVDDALVAAGAGRAEGHFAELDMTWLLDQLGISRLRCGCCNKFHGIELLSELLDESGQWCRAFLEWGVPEEPVGPSACGAPATRLRRGGEDRPEDATRVTLRREVDR